MYYKVRVNKGEIVFNRNVFNCSFYDECKLFKIVVCDKINGFLFETSANNVSDFIVGMIRLGYKNFSIAPSGFFMCDEYYCIIN